MGTVHSQAPPDSTAKHSQAPPDARESDGMIRCCHRVGAGCEGLPGDPSGKERARDLVEPCGAPRVAPDFPMRAREFGVESWTSPRSDRPRRSIRSLLPSVWPASWAAASWSNTSRATRTSHSASLCAWTQTTRAGPRVASPRTTRTGACGRSTRSTSPSSPSAGSPRVVSAAMPSPLERRSAGWSRLVLAHAHARAPMGCACDTNRRFGVPRAICSHHRCPPLRLDPGGPPSRGAGAAFGARRAAESRW
jgi:hypothetical protein